MKGDRVRTALLSVVFACALAVPRAGYGQQSWAAGSAQISIAEFLQLIFWTEMHRPEGTGQLNDWNLVTFLPGESPEESLVLVLQSYHDERVSETNLRRAIRKVATAQLDYFSALMDSPRVQKRWKPAEPSSRLIIRHVRESDLSETLGVTMDGETSFDPQTYRLAQLGVIAAGGWWP